MKDGKPKGGAWAGGGGKKGEWVEKRVWTREEIDDQDSDFGYEKFLDGGTKEGWLITFSPTTITHPETSKEIAARVQQRHDLHRWNQMWNQNQTRNSTLLLALVVYEDQLGEGERSTTYLKPG